LATCIAAARAPGSVASAVGSVKGGDLLTPRLFGPILTGVD